MTEEATAARGDRLWRSLVTSRGIDPRVRLGGAGDRAAAVPIDVAIMVAALIEGLTVAGIALVADPRDATASHPRAGPTLSDRDGIVTISPLA